MEFSAKYDWDSWYVSPVLSADETEMKMVWDDPSSDKVLMMKIDTGNHYFDLLY